jgi:hypothetical protein
VRSRRRRGEIVQAEDQDRTKREARVHAGRDVPLCTYHMEKESSGPQDRMEFLYQPEDGDPFVTWLEVSLQVLQRYFCDLR